MSKTETGKFEVTEHYELEDRGAFVIGNILSGEIRIGMCVETGLDPATLKISGIEFMDNVSEMKYWNALIFEEKPSLDFIKNAFTIGKKIEVHSKDGKC